MIVYGLGQSEVAGCVYEVAWDMQTALAEFDTSTDMIIKPVRHCRPAIKKGTENLDLSQPIIAKWDGIIRPCWSRYLSRVGEGVELNSRSKSWPREPHTREYHNLGLQRFVG